MVRSWIRNFRTRLKEVYRGLVAFGVALRVRSRTGKPVTQAGEYRCRRCSEHGHFSAGDTFPTCVTDNHTTVWFWRGPLRGTGR
jgi:hypothetical protein